jgi:hypothetical protein
VFCYEESENAVVIMMYFDRLARHILYDAHYVWKRCVSLGSVLRLVVHIWYEVQDLLYCT